MALPLLATKLYIPPLPSKLVLRTQLINRLNEDLLAGRKLILVSAPAGFGKSTLVSAWLRHCGRLATWLSLDEADREPIQFLRYLIGALQKILPGFGADLLSVLQTAQPPSPQSILVVLINEAANIPSDIILVLDDYHLVSSKEIDEALVFFIEHLPPQMCVVITAREDPSLPLARLRARNQLTEIRIADLRFRESESSEFLNRTMGLQLAARDVAALETRTEGWVAGLQLAALSMKGKADVQEFIRAFTGDHCYVADYLVEEVLQRQPIDIRNFLLQTSILERLSASLCDSVTSHPNSKARLESLARGNLFIISLDEKQNWYRYHHLFADVLRLHLQAEQPELVPVLHQRASKWYEQQNWMTDAIRHAFTAGDFVRAANLVERSVPDIRRKRQETVLLNWLERLPDELLRYRPVLCAHFAWALLAVGQLDGVESRLQIAEQWLKKTGSHSSVMVVVDEAEFQRLPGLVALYRAAYSMALGKADDAVIYAQQALGRVEDDDFLGRGASSALLGFASWWQGNLNVAEQASSEGLAMLKRAGYLSDAIGCALALADIQIVQGRLRDAMRTYQRGLQLARTSGEIVLRGAADMHVGMSRLYCEQNNLEAAEQHLLESQKLGEFAGLPQNRYRWRVAMAGIQEARGDFEEALALLDEAEQLYVGDFSPNVQPITALKVRIWLLQGRVDESLLWAQEKGLAADADLHYLREFEQIARAKVLLAHANSDASLEAVTGLLERLRKFAEAGGRMRSVIEILILQALTYQRQKAVSTALAALERALTLAEPEGYLRIFVREGAQMASLLRKSAARGFLPAYTSRLSSAFAAKKPIGMAAAGLAVSLIEPLSPRELDILRLFRTDLSGPEIAQELVVALSTVRTHTKSIFNKLNVNNRRAAVRRATELGLI